MKTLSSDAPRWSMIEPLESRIAPASLLVGGPLNEAGFKAIVGGSHIILHAGEGLSTGGPNSGAYLLYVTKGMCEVFTTDLNNNKQVDFNEITGIAAGNGLQLICFTDIHGDIVTNLNSDGTLTDSDNNASNGRDGRVLLNSRIEAIQMRSLQASDIDTTNLSDTVASHAVIASHSIYGGIYAGAGLGLSDNSGGLFFGTTNDLVFPLGTAPETSSVGPIKVGSAASGQHFNFGTTSNGPIAPTTGAPFADSTGDIRGVIATFTPSPGQVGADINGIHALDGSTAFNISTLQAGDGGYGAAGGSISNVTLTADNTGGYKVVAGNGGTGLTGGAGGSIVNFSDLGSKTSSVIIKSGDGGEGLTGSGGAGGTISFGTMKVAGAVTVKTGSGGDGFTNGGAGANFSTGVFNGVQNDLPTGLGLVSTTRDLDPILVDNSIHDPTLTSPDNPQGNYVTTPIGINTHQVPGMSANFWPSIPSIGTTQAVDFDHDGFGDTVFTTSKPDQVVVLFGDGTAGSLGVGGYNFSKTIYLDAPTSPGAVTIGDFNNDGHPDIAVASTGKSFSGVSVFLSTYVNGKFTGFTDALQSTFPVAAVPNGASIGPDTLPAMSTQVMRMVVGDFNGDQINDLAVQLQYNDHRGDQEVDVTKIIFMTGARDEKGFGSGYFYADFGNAQFATVSPIYPQFYPLSGGIDASVHSPDGALKASVASYDPNTIYNYNIPTHDLAYVADMGDGTSHSKALTVLNDSFGEPIATQYALDKVDTDRAYPSNGPHIALAQALAQDIAILDINGDGNADAVVLTKAPTGMLVVFEGNNSGGLIKVSSPDGDQNAGISIAGRDPAPGQPNGYAWSGDFNMTGTAVAIVATAASGANSTNDGIFNDIAILKTGGDAPNLMVDEFSFSHVDVLPNNTATPVVHSVQFEGNPFGEDTPYQLAAPQSGSYAFDLSTILLAPLSGPRTLAYGALLTLNAAHGSGNHLEIQNYNSIGGSGLGQDYYDFVTGNGGNGVLGSGGAAGNFGAGTLKAASFLGSALITSDITIDFTWPDGNTLDIAQGPTADFMGANLITGHGGSGFKNGGNGGTISGINLIGNWTAKLTAGKGGNGFVGNGGSGGSLLENHIYPGIRFTAGDGGDGSTGGTGGSIFGNGLGKFAVYDTEAIGSLTLTAGTGGHGLKKGGTGGSVMNFTPFFVNHGTDPRGDHYTVTAGDGGDAVSGGGGTGGSISGVSPLGTTNYLRGDISLLAGYGGSGLSGGAGGSINNFINTPSDPTVLPGAVSMVSGNGGDGVAGNGGTGGTISDVTIAAYGVGKGDLLGAKFNRVIAGAGGISTGGTGGNGGSVLNVDVTAQSGAMVVVGGAGGQGLTKGGTGGSIVNTLANSSGNAGANTAIGKVVLIAGEGGDGLASLPFNHNNPSSTVITDLDNLKSFGGVNARGGDGGSIVAFQQPASINTDVDMIAGNGGSTVNYGTSRDTTGGVGKGGSISGATVLALDGTLRANIYGSIGNSNADVAIKAYNNISGDYHADETMRQFVDSTFRNTLSIFTTLVDDNLGNVGLVAGASGRVMNNQGASFGVNGSVSNLVLLNGDSKILSMVAGAVDNIAKIQSISGVKLASGGPIPAANLGADKEVVPFGSSTAPQQPAMGQLDYYNNLGQVVNVLPQSGYALIDGLIFAANTGGLNGIRVEQA